MSGEMTAAAAAVMCATVVTVGEPVVIPLLRRAAIDVPCQRSSHSLPTPRGGGVAIAAGLLVAAALTGGVAGIAFGATVAAFAWIGLAEDLFGVPPRSRLALQLAASLLAGLVLVSGLAVPLFTLAVLAVAAAVWITGYVNAFNFMDGVNGISGAHAMVAGAVYSLMGWWRGESFLLWSGAALCAAGLAFLPWNAGRARVFLGDVGSYVLGAVVAVLGAYAVIAHVPPEAALGPAALYVADTGWTIVQRVRRREHLLEPHRTHVYQRWTDAGWSHQRVTMVTAALTALISVAGLASMTGVPLLRATADVLACVTLVAYLASPGPLLRRAAGTGQATPPASGVPSGAAQPSAGA